ncbi:MAG TPA: DinB family protein, partial [Thermoanaerobaculia bacterium]
MKTPSEIALLLSIVDEAYDRSAWHGPNLKGSLRRLTEEEAAWRPGPGRHSAWELAVHAAYWKYAVRRRLTGEKRGG